MNEMNAKNFTLEDCKKTEDELTQQAIDYANLVRNPQQKAVIANEVIAGLADRDIYLAQKNDVNTRIESLARCQKGLDERVDACVKTIATVSSKLCAHLNNKVNYQNQLKEQEKTASRKASRASVWLLAGILTLQSAYAYYELARLPNKTYVHQAYQQVLNWLKK